MHDHRQRPTAGDREPSYTTTFLLPQQDSLAGGTEDEQAIEATRAVELEQRLECSFIDAFPAVT